MLAYTNMEVVFTEDEKTQASGTTRAGNLRLMIVLLFVLIFCGGNGAGILFGFFLWKRTGSKAMGVMALVLITVIAFALAMLMVSFILKGAAEDALAAGKQESGAAIPADTKGSDIV